MAKRMEPTLGETPLSQLPMDIPHPEGPPGKRSDSSTIAPDPKLTQVGETWQADSSFGKSIGADHVPDLGQRYVVQGEIAHGGMGVVFRGLDREVGRQIAIKILREKHQDKPDLVKRFIEEAQVTGQLQHPGVAPVYEIGFLAGRLPYFTMKLIEGHTLETLLHERRKDDLEIPRFLKIFEQVAQTMAYAHTRGIIHRDLKPHNVMVGAFGEIQVMDWGLAKVLNVTLGSQEPSVEGEFAGSIQSIRHGVGEGGDSPVKTKVGAIIGTPAYMAPEQARGELARIDRRCDVFGLGAILCEILTGMPPFPGATGMESCDKACRADLKETYDRLENCDVEAGWIVLTRECLSEDPDFRPPDAGHVAVRVTAYLSDLAARVSLAEEERSKAEIKTQEAVKRRRLTRFAALVAMVLTLGVAVGVVGWFYYANQSNQWRLKLAERDLEVAKYDAEHARAVEVALVQMEGFRDKLHFQQARATLEQAELLLGDAPIPAQRMRLAQARRDLELAARIDAIHLGRLVLLGGNLAPADADADSAYAEAFRAAGIGGEQDGAPAVAARIRDSNLRPAVEAALDEWFFLAGSSARRAWLRQVRTQVDPGGGWAAIWTLIETRDTAGMPVKVRQAKGISLWLLLACGEVLAQEGHREESAEVLLMAYDRAPDDFWVNYQLGALLCEDKPADAVGFCRAAVAIRPDSSQAYNNLGAALAKLGRANEAVAVYQRSAALDVNQAIAHHNIGILLNDQGEKQAAMDAYRRALRISPGMAVAHNGLGALLADAGQYEAAKDEFEQALKISPDMVEAYDRLSKLLVAQGREQDALEVITRAVERFPKTARLHYQLGNTLGYLGRDPQAVAAYQKTVELNPDYAEAYCNMGVVLARNGDYAKAIEVTEKGVALGQKRDAAWTYGVAWLAGYRKMRVLEAGLDDIAGGKTHPANAREAMQVAWMLQVKGRHAQALRMCEDILSARPAEGDGALSEAEIADVRYIAASSAAQASVAPGIGAQQAAAYRRQALGWLRVCLGGMTRRIQQAKGAERQQAMADLRCWLVDSSLAGVRTPEALGKLPSDERTAWNALWSSCRLLLY